MAEQTKHVHHGSTPAAWTAATLALLSFLVGAIGVATQVWVIFWVAFGIMVVAAITGKVMSAMGLGAR